jgi:hypothetical protein
LAFGQVAGFFVDTCILLPHPLESTQKACQSFIEKAKDSCFIASSTKEEALALIERSHSIISNDFRNNLKPFLENENVKKITNRDGRIFANFFSEQRRKAKISFKSKSDVRNEIIGTIENYVSAQIHSIKDGVSISLDDFLASILTELELAKHNLGKPFKAIKTIDLVPNDSITTIIVLKTRMINDKDVAHLASALQHQFEQNKWVIFVTNDEKDILSREKELREIFALQCSKPSWAFDHYRDMTRRKAPIEFLKEQKTYSQDQKEFAEIMKNAMGIEILSE